MLVRLVERAIAAVVRQHRYCDWPHRGFSAGASLALKERGHSAWRLMLDDRAHVRIVVSHFERSRSDDYVGLQVDADVLGGCPAHDQPLIQRMTDVLAHAPSLALEVTQRRVA